MKKGYSLIPIRHGDMQLIRQWRNEQINFLRQKKIITKSEQEDYWKKSVLPTLSQQKPSIILYSFLCDDKLIGYGALTNIDWDHKRGEVSFLIDTDRAKNVDIYTNDTYAFLSLLKEMAFKGLKLHRLTTEIYAFRKKHIEIFEKFGFVLEGRLRDHNMIGGKYVDSIIHGLNNDV